MLWVFVLAVLLTGGASRHDVVSLVFLRPLAFGAVVYAILAARPGQWRGMPVPFYLLLALIALVALQLVPLPWGLWSALPGHAAAAELATNAGLPHTWRPLSLAPARTWNAFFSLSVPLAAFLLYRIMPLPIRRRIVPAIVLAGGASVVLGLLQNVADPDSWLYTYRVHTEGKAIGLFANRNHQGIFLACVILFAAVYSGQLRPNDKSAYLKLTLLGGLVAALVPFILVLGSRAGLLLGLAALILTAVLLLRAPLLQGLFARLASRRGWMAGRASPRVLLFGLFAVLIGCLAALAIRNARDESFARLSDSGAASPFDRGEILGYLWQMTKDFFPSGAGFGSFDAVFHAYETRDMLSTTYLNQAHNDWLQFVIEGGLPAALLLAIFVAWLGLRLVSAWRDRSSSHALVRFGMLGVTALIAAGSAVDYPMRVPIMMMLLAFAMSLLVDEEYSLTPANPRR